MRTSLYIGVMAVLLASSCGKNSDSGGGDKPAASSSQYICKIHVKKKASQPVTADGSDPDEAKATDAAWKAVCDKLPAADQPNCKDKDKWAPSLATMSATVNGKKSTTVTIKLEQQMPETKGKGSSSTSEDEACKAATLEACKKAGETGDCVAAGTYEQAGKSTEKTTVGM